MKEGRKKVQDESIQRTEYGRMEYGRIVSVLEVREDGVKGKERRTEVYNGWNMEGWLFTDGI
jgi:hypothetical protein